jgi:predicted GNAT family acetyltransferase
MLAPANGEEVDVASEIVHDEAQRRFTLDRDGQASYLVYHRVDESTVDFVHTYTPPALRGRGIAARIVEHALGWADAQGLKVVPSCWFVAEYVERFPAWERVVASR